eukprot:TRINITY_DN15852_c0_g1_i1.p1 TRINITY_DN15852_c0_g1~~TRINITY_DN15852_c0_g1_i1.p1  ORF type:complete len:398 (+),score=54.18 TRINITY_DN15852_c0_g1_i1:106-1299(+)
MQPGPAGIVPIRPGSGGIASSERSPTQADIFTPQRTSWGETSFQTATSSVVEALAGVPVCSRSAAMAVAAEASAELSGSGTELQMSEQREASSPAGWSAEGVPVVEQHTFRGSGAKLSRAPPFSIGVDEEQGRRAAMEDSHALHAQLPGAPPGTAFFLVCDGHAGRQVADHVAELLPMRVAAHLASHSGFSGADPSVVLPSAYVEVDREVYRRCGMVDSGAAAVAALLRGPELWVAHLGDCRAVMCDGGTAVPLTRDHRASDPQEKLRLQAAGAIVIFGRVCGSLMTSRNFGDFGFKGGDALLSGPAVPVSNLPEIARFVLTTQSEFLLLACDGVFDVFSNEQAVALCRQHAARGARVMAQELVSAALAKGTMDNVTAAVITFGQQPQPASQGCQED